MTLFTAFSADRSGSPTTLDKLLQFSQAINSTESQTEVIDHFLKQLKVETCAASVGLFMKTTNSNRLQVYIEGLTAPPQTVERSGHDDLKSMLDANKWTVEQVDRGQKPLSGTLYTPGLKSYLLAPIISGKASYGALKLDLLHKITLSLSDKKILQLMILQLANRWEDLQQHQLLEASICDSFFDKTLLALRNNSIAENAPKILQQQFAELVAANPKSPLPTKWRFYYSAAKRDLKYLDVLDCNRTSIKFKDEPHYREHSHIHHFIDDNAAMRLYTQLEIRRYSLQKFHTQMHEKSASLCINTGFKVNQIPQWGLASETVYVVIWADDSNLLERYKDRYQELVNQLARQIESRLQNPVKADEYYLKKTQDIMEQLFQINEPKALFNFVVQQAKALVPGADVASYGEVTTKDGDDPIITIKAVTDGGLPKYHGFPHPLKNDGLWQRLWETQATITINNNYSQPRIKVAPINEPRSAIVIPLFVDNKLYGVLNLCAGKENTFQPDRQDVLEWLVQTFSARLRELKRRLNVFDSKISTESRETQAIAELIEFFTGEKGESTQIEVDELVKTAIDKIIPYTGCSHWGLFKGDYGHYEVLTHRNLSLNRIILNNLQFSPIGDILRGDSNELIAGTLRSDNRFPKLLPLFPAMERCLALPIRIQEYRSPEQQQADKPRAKTRLLALFLFHYDPDKFTFRDMEFLKLVISLLEALMRQRAFQNEIDRITPLALSGAMAAQVAHEIKNPCQPLSSFISTMEKAWQENLWVNELFTDGMDQRFNDAKSALKRINANVVHLINLSDITHHNFTPISIAEVLEDVCSYQWYGEEIVLKKEQPIKITLDPVQTGLPAICFDKFHLSTILTNLIQNAAQAIESSAKRTGEIQVSVVLHLPTKQDIKQNSTIAHYPLEIRVKDDGPGIAADVKRRMFAPFETTKHKGTGLGCTICERMMGNIGGKIAVDSVLGQGATLRLLFPKDALIYPGGKA